MRYLSVYKTVERDAPPTQEEMDRMGKLIEDGMKEMSEKFKAMGEQVYVDAERVKESNKAL